MVPSLAISNSSKSESYWTGSSHKFSPVVMSYAVRSFCVLSLSLFHPPQKRIFFPSGENVRAELQGDFVAERNFTLPSGCH